MANITKALKESYNKYGIAVSGGKIVSPIGLVAPLIKIGTNTKLGKTVASCSVLAGKKTYKTKYGNVPGTCPFNCKGCYAMQGKFNCASTVNSNAVNTILAREFPEFFEKAIRAQLDTMPGIAVRLHAAGDFFSKEYANIWRGIVRDYPGNEFWTYTKAEFENTFDNLPNGNIVKSIIPEYGFNFGTIEYILRAYMELVARGEKPYICRCTFDKMQHCENCKGCIDNKYVLFVKHSTPDYKAEKDPLFPVACDIVNAQKDHTPAEICDMIRAALNIK